VAAIGVQAVRPQLPRGLGQARIVGEQRAAIAVRAQRLRRIERRGRDIAERTGAASRDARAKALRRVGDQRQTVAPGDRFERRVVRTLAVKVDCDDRPRPADRRP